MSHGIEPNVDTVYTPAEKIWNDTWHDLHTPTTKQRISLNGSNVPFVFCPIISGKAKPDFGDDVVIDEETQREINNWQVLAADCRKGKSGKIHPVHVPKSSYTVHQNNDLFRAMVKSAVQVLGRKGFKIVTVGTLFGYRQFFMSLAIRGHDEIDMGEGDNWKQFFNLTSSHCGEATARMLSYIRQVCANTVNFSLNESAMNGTRQNISHTKNSLDLITPESFASDLEGWINDAEAYKVKLSALKAQTMNSDGFSFFAAGTLTDKNSDKISQTGYNRVQEMIGLFNQGDGNEGKTRYDAFNAFTDFFTHGTRTRKTRTAEAKRIVSASFGRGNDWKREAFRILSNEGGDYAETLERGERLLKDKALIDSLN